MATDLACQRARHGGRLADFWLWGPALAHARCRPGRHGSYVVGPEPIGKTQGAFVYQRQIRPLAGRVATGTDRVERRTIFGGQVPATNRTTAPRTAHRKTAARTACPRNCGAINPTSSTRRIGPHSIRASLATPVFGHLEPRNPHTDEWLGGDDPNGLANRIDGTATRVHWPGP